jgi:signal transduction histidine kinase/ActR/RegA family two-component response regulator
LNQLYQSAPFRWVCALVFTAAAALAARWVFLCRRRALRRRDDQVFQLLDQWTKSLQMEVAERKEAQRALQESQQMLLRQERLAAVGQLAAGLAHEFNNILTIVQGHASLLMDNPNLDPESLKSLSHITDGVERTAKLIQQMLAFSRQQIIQPKPLDLQHALGQTSDMSGRLLGENVLLRYEIASGLPRILADPQMLQQILINLLLNARDAIGGAGQVTISAIECLFAPADIPPKSERRPGRFVRLRVSDTGAGMDPATITHLFEPFFTTKEVGKGAGLGLATVYGIVNQHQGWIEVQSQPGRGATFDLFFPATNLPAEVSAEEALAPEIPGGKETILVAEDELVLRDLLREILTGHGYTVLEAADGLEALQLWEANRGRIDLLLTDIAMPHGLSGRDLAAKLRQQNPRLPVIFSSGHSQEMVQSGEVAAPGVAYLSKPYRPAQLTRIVRETLDAARKPESSLAAPAP